MSRPMTEHVLRQENLAYIDSGGVSANAQKVHLVPAFQDVETGRIEIARMQNGCPAAMHLIVGLPEEWAVNHDLSGQISALKATIIAGFVRENVFYTREQAADLIA